MKIADGFVVVRNRTKETYVDKFNGKEFIFEPGDRIVVPEAAAELWLGKFRAAARSEEYRVSRERARLRLSLPPGTEFPLTVEGITNIGDKIEDEVKEEPVEEAVDESKEEEVIEEDKEEDSEEEVGDVPLTKKYKYKKKR